MAAFETGRDPGDETDARRASCATCGLVIPINDSAEWPLVQMGARVEFYHCLDRRACAMRAAAKIDRR